VSKRVTEALAAQSTPSELTTACALLKSASEAHDLVPKGFDAGGVLANAVTAAEGDLESGEPLALNTKPVMNHKT
jgi:hypothetical protein